MKTPSRIILVIAALAVVVIVVLRSSKNASPEAQVAVATASKANAEIAASSSSGPERVTPLTVSSSGQPKDRAALGPYLETVEAKFGLVLSSFNIAPDRLDRLKKLLAEREAAKADLSELKGSRDQGVISGARAASGKIEEGFRKEAQGILTDAEWPNVSRMLDAEYTLFGLENEVAAPLVKSGNPLSGGQLFLVADELHTLYGDGAGDPVQYVATIDPTTYLTSADTAVLRQLNGALSQNQISAIQAILKERNQRLARVAAMRTGK